MAVGHTRVGFVGRFPLRRSLLTKVLLTADVDPTTRLTACGLVRIKPCAAPQKGLGAFAAQAIPAGHLLGHYLGEVISLGDMIARYGGDGDSDSPFEYDAANEQALWVTQRKARGVTVTGTYLFNAGQCPVSRKIVLVDAEDQTQANFTRYLNHSVRKANLDVTYEVLPPPEGDAVSVGRPLIQFIASRHIAAGEELLFDYGDGLDIEVMDFVDD